MSGTVGSVTGGTNHTPGAGRIAAAFVVPRPKAAWP